MSEPFVPAEVVRCIATGEPPTSADLLAVAERIWRDGCAHRSAFAWDRLPSDAPERVVTLKAARVALGGADG